MKWFQLKSIHNDTLFSVGGHSHHHIILSFLDKTHLEKEIEISMRLLKTKCEIQTHHYSYPEGLEKHYSDEVINILKKYGIICCPTAINGTNLITDDLFHLKRVMIT